MKRLARVGLVLVVFLGACSSDEPTDADPTPVATEETSDTPTSAPQPTESAPAALIEDGRHAVYITEAVFEAREITVDVIQFLTGDAADEAYQEEYGGSDEVENDYYIVNENTRLRTLIVAEDATVEVIWQDEGDTDRADPDPIEFSELHDYLQSRPGSVPFWIEVTDETVTKIEEQYVP